MTQQEAAFCLIIALIHGEDENKNQLFQLLTSICQHPRWRETDTVKPG